jgi:predicted anti-sigma-YlaC factor YlaD
VLLAMVAVQLVVLSLRDLLWPSSGDAGLHEVRHLAAFTLAYGMLLIAVVIRPTRAAAALPAATVLAVALAITAIVDLAAGRIPLAGEAMHIPEVISVILIRILTPTDRPSGMIRLLKKPTSRPTARNRKAS